MWVLAIISLLICIILWYYQIKNNIEKKRRRKKEKVIRKLEKYAQQSEFASVYEEIIDLYEASDSVEIEEIIHNSTLPRYEKGPVILELNKILRTGIDEKTGLHKKTLVIGKLIGYFISICFVVIWCILKEWNISLLEVILVYACSNVIITIASYIIIESILLKRLPWSRQDNKVKEENNTVKQDKFWDRVFDVLDNIFGQY